jgi:nucleoside-diphosphate-sugar epimerase/predicted dehydrogenase
MKQKILITGAAGFVGRHLVKSLREHDYEVIAMVRENTDTAFLKALGVWIVKGDLRNQASLQQVFRESYDGIVHVATTMKGPWEEYWEGTVQGTRRLVELAAEKDVKKFVFLSSISVYDLSSLHGSCIDENTPLMPETCADYYEKSKILAEKEVKKFFTSAMTCTILRPGAVYGPGGAVFVSRLGFSAGKTFVVIGNGENRIPLVYVGNLVEAIRLTLESDWAQGEIFNIIDDPSISQNRYLQAIKSQAKPWLRIVRVPYPVAIMLTEMLNIFLKIVKQSSPLRRPYLYTCSHQLEYSTAKAKQKLAWKPKYVAEEALAQTVHWLAESRLNPKIVDAKRHRRPITLQRPVRVGLIGCGVIATTHLDILKTIANVEIVGLCDTNLQAAEALSLQHGSIPPFKTPEEMFRQQKIDVVHILTPPQSRKALVEIAARHKAHIFLEKPMAFNAADAAAIVAIAKCHGVQVCIGHNHVFDPPMIEARKLIADGALGEVLYAESWYGVNLGANLDARYMIPGAENHWTMQLPGKLYQNYISHPLSVLTDVIGSPLEVESHTIAGKVVKSMKNDELKVFLKTKTGKIGLLTISFAVNPRYQFLHVYGTNMCLYVDFLNKTLIKHATPKGIPKSISRAMMSLTSGRVMITSTMTNAAKVLLKRFTYYDGMEILIKEFYIRLTEGGPMPISAEEGLESMEIMDKVWSRIGL